VKDSWIQIRLLYHGFFILIINYYKYATIQFLKPEISLWYFCKSRKLTWGKLFGTVKILDIFYVTWQIIEDSFINVFIFLHILIFCLIYFFEKNSFFTLNSYVLNLKILFWLESSIFPQSLKFPTFRRIYKVWWYLNSVRTLKH
jgi:hypothetical protein